jgi:thiopeptide-type bacteriocin biosynthesis protein
MTWTQVSCAVFPREGLPPVHIPWASLRDACDTWRAEGRYERMWFVRKPPGLRLRFEAPAPQTTLEPVLAPWLVAAERSNDLRGFRFTVYEPEEHRFGGAAGMALAHELFDLDSRALLDPLGRHMTPEERAAWFVRTTQSLLHGAVDDRSEAWDVWRRLDTALDVDLAPARNVELAAALEASEPDYREIGTRVRACADSGLLTVGVRQWCADAATFGLNRLGLIFWPETLRAALDAAARWCRPEPG